MSLQEHEDGRGMVNSVGAGLACVETFRQASASEWSLEQYRDVAPCRRRQGNSGKSRLIVQCKSCSLYTQTDNFLPGNIPPS